jgi:hypothetical protein
MTGRRIQLGRQVHILEETSDGLHLEGVARLRPGQLIELAPMPGAESSPAVRNAWVVSWSVARLGKEGPTYRGLCRWQ